MLLRTQHFHQCLMVSEWDLVSHVLSLLGAIRELLGGGTILSTGSSALVDLSNFGYTPASIFILAPGAFFVLAMCVAVMNRVKRKHGMKPAEVPDYVSDEEKEN